MMQVEKWKNGVLESVANIKETEAELLAELEQIDIKSIRALREWVAAQPSAPQWLKEKELAAQAARAKLGGA